MRPAPGRAILPLLECAAVRLRAPSRIVWVEADGITSATAVSAGDGRGFRLVVEPMPDAGWDWTVWEIGQRGAARYGMASSPEVAMRCAEDVLGEMASESGELACQALSPAVPRSP
jgi:hypothetical protein